MLCFVLINSVLLNLPCAWIFKFLTWGARNAAMLIRSLPTKSWKGWPCRVVCNTFATHDVTDTDCGAQNVGTHNRVFATFKSRYIYFFFFFFFSKTGSEMERTCAACMFLVHFFLSYYHDYYFKIIFCHFLFYLKKKKKKNLVRFFASVPFNLKEQLNLLDLNVPSAA